ncbi:TPA: glycosyltransferase [Aeromonas veronii]|uniref:glycosyltransferase n=1 Tax=Aeromonas TaxID=642 RepID=UPI0021E8DDE7|nr:glycosyltransferase [Aeromonas veronii]MCV3285902.1 glycosyltransferase [Aeromonas veronii]
MCTYNGSLYLKEQIDSIFRQSILPSFILISDNNSSDSTVNECHRLFEFYGFLNYKIISFDGKGAANNFIYALSQYESEADFLFLSDQDDVWVQDKADIQISIMRQADIDMPSIVYTDSLVVGSSLQLINASFFSFQGLDERVFLDNSIYFRNCVQGATLSLNKRAVALVKDSIKKVNTTNILMHDWWIAILIHHYGVAMYLNKPLVQYRQHCSNTIGARKRRTIFSYFFNVSDYLRSCDKSISQCNEFFLYTKACDSFYSERKSIEINTFKSVSAIFNFFILGMTIHYIPILKRMLLFVVCLFRTFFRKT